MYHNDRSVEDDQYSCLSKYDLNPDMNFTLVTDPELAEPERVLSRQKRQRKN